MEDMSKLYDMIRKKDKDDVFVRIETTGDKCTQITLGPTLKTIQLLCNALLMIADKAGMPYVFLHACLDAVIESRKEGE